MFSWRRERPDDEVQIWDCNPLVIHHEHDGIVYAQNTKVEFTPQKDGFGSAQALTPTSYGWTPRIQIDGWQEPVKIVTIPGYQAQKGRTLFGHDDAGDSFTWYIGQDGIDFLHSENEEIPPEEVDQ